MEKEDKIIDNSTLQQGDGDTGTTPTSGQQQVATTPPSGQSDVQTSQTTEQNQAPATQTTDANQASGGEDNAGVKADATTPPTNVAGNVLTGGTQQVRLPDGSLVNQNVQLSDGDLARYQQTFGDGVAQPAAATPSYLADWGNTSFMDAVRAGNKPIAEYMSDYNKWANANNKEPLDIFTMMQAINGNDINESYAANEKAAKRLKRQQTWEQIGNVLNHLGNFVGTMMGAPSATYETGQQLTARQQAVRDAIEKQRGDPKNILAMIWKDRADQRARELNNANIDVLGARKANIEGDTANDKAKADADVALKGSQKTVYDTAAEKNTAQTKYTNDKNTREKELLPYQKGQYQSVIHRNNASAENSEASAQKNRVQTQTLSRQAQDDTDFESLYTKYPELFKEYAENNHLDVNNNRTGEVGGGSWSNKGNRRAAVRWARHRISHGYKKTIAGWK